MNKIRLIPAIFIKDGFIVRSENFISHKKIGNVVNEIQRYNHWNIDELFLINISRKKDFDTNRQDHKIQAVKSLDEILNLVSKECFMPLTFGGGIRNYKTIKKLINEGADKVVINTMLHTDSEAVIEAVRSFGSQAIVGCIDYKCNNNILEFYTDNGSKKLNLKFDDLISHLNYIGVGEIFLNSIDNDGKGEGYDIEIIKKFISSIDLPIVACGGASSIYDFKQLSKIEGISGIAAGNMFHFTENIYPRAKKELINSNLNFR